MSKYTAKDIIKLSDIDVIRKNTSMYIGSTEDPTQLVMEVIDNVFDEIQAGFCNKMKVVIDNENGTFEVIDWGRGFPFDEQLPLEKDPPILACIEMSTSGKFNKDKSDSPYKIASGLHGIGLTAVNALSEWVEIEIYRDGKHAKYKLVNSKNFRRKIKPIKDPSNFSIPFSTKISAKPKPRFFKSPKINIDKVLERLELAKIDYPHVEIIFSDTKQEFEIQANIGDILKSLQTGSEELEWNYLEFKNDKTQESYKFWFTWEDNGTITPRFLSSVNLVTVHQGVHINKVYQILRNIFSKQRKYKFERDDIFIGFRGYLNLKIVETAFDAQVKVRLESKSNISILDNLEKQLTNFFQTKPAYFEDLCKRFEAYRRQRNSKLIKTANGKSRSSTKLTRLKDCLEPNGELLIGEGDSAIGGLNSIRDIKTQAVLPLRGVVPNAITMPIKKLLQNDVISDLVQAVGCGYGENCNIDYIRYSKILLAADADPAGKFITSLLIMLFARLMPDVIKHGFLYVCKTPLYGIGRGKDFKPIWTEQELEEYRKKGTKIRRFKGLGEFDPPEIYEFTFGKSRQLYQVKWSENFKFLEKLFSSPEERRKLLEG